MKAIFRADAGVAMGTGHLMRCFALAQHFMDAGGHAKFVVTEAPAPLLDRIRDEGMGLLLLNEKSGGSGDALKTANSAADFSADWIVADGYHFGAEYQLGLRSQGQKLLFFDDHGHAKRYFADLIVNQNAFASSEFYLHREAYCRLLLGTRYAVLRREFTSIVETEKPISARVKKILVTMGGSDPDDVTSRVVEALLEFTQQGMEIAVLVGSGNPHAAEIRDRFAMLGAVVKVIVDTNEIVDWMKWADLGVTSGGTTCLELASRGVPALITPIAQNQIEVARALSVSGAAMDIVGSSDKDMKRIHDAVCALRDDNVQRTGMSKAGRKLVDGKGASRIVQKMNMLLELRPVEEMDSRLILEWANEPSVREVSFEQRPISPEEHSLWFKAKLLDDHCRFYIATDRGGQSIGCIRFDMDHKKTIVSLIVGEKYRGKGYGSEMLRTGCELFFSETGTGVLHAYVLQENRCSLALFEKEGFERVGSDEIKGKQAVHFVLRRDS